MKPLHIIKLTGTLLFLILGLASTAPIAGPTPSFRVYTESHDVVLLVGQSSDAIFYVQLNETQTQSINLTIVFQSDDASIVSVNPPSVDVRIEPGQLKVNFTIHLKAEFAGRTTIVANSSNSDVKVDQAFLRMTVSHFDSLSILSDVVGWLYFVAWSISFYPQIYENFQRKSVIGLNFDFLTLNIIGFTLYGLFNIALYVAGPIQEQYFVRHPTGVNPVLLNDVIFAVHAAFACVITIAQCFVYERGNQSVSKVCKLIIVGIAVFLLISLILAISSVLAWLDFLYFCSYVKLFITLIKYIPQAYMNYRRKSTMGWSIGNVLLDFTGGFLSIAQMFIQSYNNNDWGTIFGDPTKFGLGLFSVVFDVLFIVQHYVLYRNNQPSEPLINNDLEYDDDRPSDNDELSN